MFNYFTFGLFFFLLKAKKAKKSVMISSGTAIKGIRIQN